MVTRYDLPNYLNDLGLVGYGVEVGVLRGDFSGYLLKGWLGKKLYLVDSWCGTGLMDINDGGRDFHGDNLAKTFNVIYGYGYRATIIRDSSVGAMGLFGDNFLDFVFIDGSHDRVSVGLDLAGWYEKVKVGGLVMGHDYADGVWRYPGIGGGDVEFGVKSAVDFFVMDKGLDLKLTERDESFFPSYYFHKE